MGSDKQKTEDVSYLVIHRYRSAGVTFQRGDKPELGKLQSMGPLSSGKIIVNDKDAEGVLAAIVETEKALAKKAKDKNTQKGDGK